MSAQMPVLNIAGYKFLPLTDLLKWQDQLKNDCQTNNLKGTILLSVEGININLAGSVLDIQQFMKDFNEQTIFCDIHFHQSYSETVPFKRLKVKMKQEIITLRKPIEVHKQPAPSVSPQLFKHWLDSKRDMIVLDTRNEYEVKFGTFNQAKQLHLKDFSEFPDAIDDLPHSKPIVMFCTGGIRCEKAANYLLKKGYQEVYQLQGGILGYFADVGDSHYHGDCFIFDERIAVDPNLAPSTLSQCKQCQMPIASTAEEAAHHCHS